VGDSAGRRFQDHPRLLNLDGALSKPRTRMHVHAAPTSHGVKPLAAVLISGVNLICDAEADQSVLQQVQAAKIAGNSVPIPVT
jgi:hypothetical protein